MHFSFLLIYKYEANALIENNDINIILRKNNMNIPLLVGGDFNLDLKSFEPLTDNPGLLLVNRFIIDF